MTEETSGQDNERTLGIVFTGYDGTEPSVVEAVESANSTLGCARHLVKPLRLDGILSAINGHLGVESELLALRGKLKATDGCIAVVDDDPHIRKIITDIFNGGDEEMVASYEHYVEAASDVKLEDGVLTATVNGQRKKVCVIFLDIRTEQENVPSFMGRLTQTAQ